MNNAKKAQQVAMLLSRFDEKHPLTQTAYDLYHEWDRVQRELQTMQAELRKVLKETGNARALTVYQHLGRVIKELKDA